MAPPTEDLVCLVADGNIRETLSSLLRRRNSSLRIREIRVDFVVHPEHDPGCFLRSHDLLRTFVGRFRHALVVFDREGCGREQLSRTDLEEELERRLYGNGWNDRARAIAIDPELEAWFWSKSPHVSSALGWRDHRSLQTWLVKEGHLKAEDQVKPQRPKEAIESALKISKTPRSSSIYGNLATRASFQNCTDPSFKKFCEILKGWFPAS